MSDEIPKMAKSPSTDFSLDDMDVPSPASATFDFTSENKPVHTGSFLSPLALYLQDLKADASKEGETVELPPEGPALQSMANLAGEINDVRRQYRANVARKEKCMEEEERALVKKQVAERLKKEGQERTLRDERRKKTMQWMRERPLRIKACRRSDGRFVGCGLPWHLKGIPHPRELENMAWADIERAKDEGELEWQVHEETRPEYEESLAELQDRIDERFQRWFDFHDKLFLESEWEGNRWIDENVTYPVRNRQSKYLEEVIRKTTYHWGIPQSNHPVPPIIVPHKRKQHRDGFVACFQCVADSLPSRCVLERNGCSRCVRKGERCLALVPADVIETRKGRMDLEKARAWFTGEKIAEREDREAGRRRKWFEEGRWEVMEWVGGEKGFVERNAKKETWALPRWERDENGKAVPHRS